MCQSDKMVPLAILLRFLGGLFLWKGEQPIFGHYHQRGMTYYIKFFFIYAFLLLRKWWNKRAAKGDAGYGRKALSSESEMEQVQPLSGHPKAIDAIYFNAGSRDGQNLVLGLARRPAKVINGFLILKVPNVGVLLTPKMPDTMLYAENDNEFSAEGLSCSVVEPMKKWRISYKGSMKLDGQHDKTYDVQLDAIWQAVSPSHDYDTDIPSWSMARAIATEPWTMDFFQRLREIHQTHYEQLGTIKGTAVIDGETHELHMESGRDHSFGKMREWKLLRRYGLHTFALEDGTRMQVTVVHTVTTIELGFIWLVSPDGTGTKVNIDRIDLQLWQHGENGTPPVDYGFSFWAGGQRYDVQVNVQDSPEFHIGWEWEARIVERLAKFNVNGVDGWGISEWYYVHDGGRPKEIEDKDPEWTKQLVKG